MGIENRTQTSARRRRELSLDAMLLVPLLIVVVFSYIPMVGLTIAFQDFIPARGLFGDQRWVGLENFSYVLRHPVARRALVNTIMIAAWKIVGGLAVPIVFAVALNEVRRQALKRTLQTLVYLPHFLSWIILSGVLIDILSPSHGIVNRALGAVGVEPVFFLGDNGWFPFTIVISHLWKEFGFGTVVFIAAITGIDPQLYESAEIDGAGRFRQMIHVTLPGMMMIIVVIATLSLGNVLNAGFEQIFNLYSPQVYESGDILDTLIYRIGLLEAQYGPATAIGLFKALVSLVFISVSYWFAYRFADYRIF